MGGSDFVGRVAHGDEPLLDVRTVAERLAISVTSVRRLIQRGELAAVYVGRRAVRVPESAVEAYLRGHSGD